ncbi:MAG: hypothetical protein JXR77_10665 [Lentisphaeria bacterium]|nr:hypothetical protein [Lentisphaeria bacterium]
MNLRRRDRQDQRGFAELREFFSRWYPDWRSCFGSPEPTVVQVEYWNNINKHVVPGSASDEYVEVKDLFASFAATPMPPHAEKYVVPYRYEANWAASVGGRTYRLSAGIRALPVKPLTVQARFAAAFVGAAARPVDPEHELDALHDLLLGVFDVFFTAKAKEAFA